MSSFKSRDLSSFGDAVGETASGHGRTAPARNDRAGQPASAGGWGRTASAGWDGKAAPGGAAIRSGLLAKAVDEGDELVIETLREAARFLGLGLASAINLYNPQRIILGGGVIEAVPMLLQIAAPLARGEALPVPGRAVEIVAAKLGDNAGIVGAAILGAS